MVEKILEASLYHITPETKARLEHGKQEYPLTFFRKEEWAESFPYEKVTGFFILVPARLDLVKEQIPEDLYRALDYAAYRGCKWLLLDEGAGKVSVLPDHTGEWA